MTANFFYFRYPQYLFVKAIESTLYTFGLNTNTLADAPCGDGVISYWLQKEPNRRIRMLDIDSNLVDICKSYMPDLDAKQGDIFKLEPQKQDEIWLFINSMYCLPKIEGLIEEKRKKFSYVLGIFPDISNDNYRCFNRRNPEVNQSPLSIMATIAYFQSKGYAVAYEQSLIHIPFFCTRLLNNRWVQRYLIYIDVFFKPFVEPAYKLILFKLSS